MPAREEIFSLSYLHVSRTPESFGRFSTLWSWFVKVSMWKRALYQSFSFLSQYSWMYHWEFRELTIPSYAAKMWFCRLLLWFYQVKITSRFWFPKISFVAIAASGFSVQCLLQSLRFYNIYQMHGLKVMFYTFEAYFKSLFRVADVSTGLKYDNGPMTYVLCLEALKFWNL